jgi:hypothetical protein
MMFAMSVGGLLCAPILQSIIRSSSGRGEGGGARSQLPKRERQRQRDTHICANVHTHANDCGLVRTEAAGLKEEEDG